MGGSKDYSYEWTKDADTTIIGTTASIANLLAKECIIYLLKDTNGCTLPKVI
jgi:hypothetical protein